MDSLYKPYQKKKKKKKQSSVMFMLTSWASLGRCSYIHPHNGKAIEAVSPGMISNSGPSDPWEHRPSSPASFLWMGSVQLCRPGPAGTCCLRLFKLGLRSSSNPNSVLVLVLFLFKEIRQNDPFDLLSSEREGFHFDWFSSVWFFKSS